MRFCNYSLTQPEPWAFSLICDIASRGLKSLLLKESSEKHIVQTKPRGWQQVFLVYEISKSRDFKITMQLNIPDFIVSTNRWPNYVWSLKNTSTHSPCPQLSSNWPTMPATLLSPHCTTPSQSSTLVNTTPPDCLPRTARLRVDRHLPLVLHKAEKVYVWSKSRLARPITKLICRGIKRTIINQMNATFFDQINL